MNRTPTPTALSPDLLRKMDAYWRAANYLSVGQIYLYDNPLLKEPLARHHIKPRLLGQRDVFHRAPRLKGRSGNGLDHVRCLFE